MTKIFREVTSLPTINFVDQARREWRSKNNSAYRPTCHVKDHKWQIVIEEGRIEEFFCIDPHSEIEIFQMDSCLVPGCIVDSYLVNTAIEVKLDWASDCPKPGAGWHGLNPCDCDSWLEIKEVFDINTSH